MVGSTLVTEIDVILTGAGEADGAASVAGVGASLTAGAGEADGVAAGAGGGASLASAAGEIDGAASTSGVGASLAAAAGDADGSSSVSGAGLSLGPTAIGHADGDASVAGAGASIARSAGAASAAATVTGAGAALVGGAGEADGSANVTGAGASIRRSAGPFFFAWVDPSETVFGPQHERYDETVLSIDIEHREGDIPSLTVEIKNPFVGFLSPGRKIWAWLSWLDPATNAVKPLFFGRLVGIPTDISDYVCTAMFTAKAVDYTGQKEDVATDLSELPYWDPLFIPLDKRSDPDEVLNGYSRMWHVDRVSLAVTASDILLGEDGTETFEGTDVFFDNFKVTVGETPLSNVLVDATVNWTQQFAGHIDLGQQTTTTYTGDALIGGWPKPYTGLGGGWGTGYCYALDKLGVQFAEVMTLSASYQNNEATHEPGDVMSLQSSQSFPSLDGTGSVYGQVINSSFTTAYIDPDPDTQDHPTASSKVTRFYAMPWTVETYMTLTYQRSAQFTERARISLFADVQEVLTQLAGPDTIPGDTPDFERISLTGADPTQPILIFSQQQVQDAINSGIALPSSTVAELSYSTTYSANTVVSSKPFDNGTTTYPQEFFITSDGASVGTGLDSLGRPPLITLPNGQPVPGPIPPPVAVLEGGFSQIPGGPILAHSSNYFPQGRGLQSIEYLICRARARLLARSRAVTIEFDCPFERAINLSCRKNALVYDQRIPGGVALGKIIAYSIKVDGTSGLMIGHVTIGCAVGNGNSIGAIEGVPVYVNAGYVKPGYQRYSGSQLLTDSGDVTFSPPFPGSDGDGIRFPIQAGDVVLSNTLIGNAGNQSAAIAEAIAAMQARLSVATYLFETPQAQFQRRIAAAKLIQQIGFNFELERTSQYILSLKSLDGGPFGQEYEVATSSLSVPKMIDLAA